jgi:hypothetical protein
MQIKRIWILFLTAAISITAYYGTECALSPACGNTDLWRDLSNGLFDPVFLYTLWILPVSALILFVPISAYRKWQIFSLWWFAVSVLVLSAFDTRVGGWMNIFPITRIVVTWLMAGLYFLISLIVLTVQTTKARKTRE